MDNCPESNTTLSQPTAEQWTGAIHRALAGDGIRPVYQPIVDLQRATIVGYEALTRFDPVAGQQRGPDCWFKEAYGLGLGAALNAAALRAALSHRSNLPRNCFLSVNIDPDSLLERCVLDVLAAEGNLTGLVIEITEHRPWVWEEVAPVISRLQTNGAIFAVDDAGAGYAGLNQILQLRPKILKLDRALIEDIDHDEAKVALVEMLGLFANRVDAWILAEGVETAGEARRLLELRVPLVQGYYFGHPGEAWASLEAEVAAELNKHAHSGRPSLHLLVDPIAPIPQDEGTAEHWVLRDEDWIPVTDEHRRPTGLVNAEAALAGTLIPSLVVNVHSTPQEVAIRMCTADAEPTAPVVVADDAGQYVGLLSVRRLLSVIARGSDAEQTVAGFGLPSDSSLVG